MAVEVNMPRQGQSVETCLILEWKKKTGERVKIGDILCVVETDKASFEVEAPAEGELLKTFFEQGEDVPVLSLIAVLGEHGEDIAGITGAVGGRAQQKGFAVSPRAKRLAIEKGIDCTVLKGTGPGGRVIVRDVQKALELVSAPAAVEPSAAGRAGEGLEFPGQFEEIPVKGVRKLICERLLSSLQTTAQYTLNSSAEAESLLAYRKRLKESPQGLELGEISISDLINFAAVRVLARQPGLNGHFTGERIVRFKHVHLGFAVDTPRGLMVPVIRFADRLSLKAISEEAGRLSQACAEAKINPDELKGGTFTVTNLGSLGVESFTPILNPPQLGILGVGGIQLKPVQREDSVKFVKAVNLCLTVNHQVIDGAPAALFLKQLIHALEHFDL
ncbi:Dihydrolipoyllysine-residue acetyltransferase component of pyruvate dehydrogenase complex [subsurface metagenome]